MRHPFNRRRRSQGCSVRRAAAAAVEGLESRTLLSSANYVYFSPYGPPAGVEGAAADAGGTIDVQVNRSADVDEPLTINVSAHGVGDYPATPGEDFTMPSTVTFPAGETMAYAHVNVGITDDDIPEPYEQFAVTVEPGQGYDVDGGAAGPDGGQVCTIVESDVPHVWAEADENGDGYAHVAEGGGGSATILLKRDNTHDDLAVRYSMHPDGGAGWGWASDDDYLVDGVGPDENGIYEADFPAGEDTVLVEVAAVDDRAVEFAEGFRLIVEQPAAGEQAIAGQDKYETGRADGSGGGSADGVIDDDDYDVSVSASGSADEGTDGVAGFWVHRYGELYNPLTVGFDMSGGSATPGEDFDSGPFDAGEVAFDAGEADEWLPLTPTDDENPEWTEDALLTLAEADDVNLVGGAAAAAVPIRDNDLGFELQQGTLVANYDDDNGDGITDYLNDPGVGSADDDLYEMKLHVPKPAKPGTSAWLSVPADFVNVYDSASKGTLLNGGGDGIVAWDDAADVPDSVYLEIKKGSAAVGDVTIGLGSSDNGDDQFVDQQNTAINLRIVAETDPNGDGGGEITNKSRKWLVGQVVDQHVEIDCPDAWKTAPTYDWTMSGDILRDYIRTDALGQRVPVVDDEVVNGRHEGYLQSAIDFFWEDSAVGAVDTKTVSVNVGNINGQTFTLECKYAVETPTVWANTVAGTEGFDNNAAPTQIGIFNAGDIATRGIGFTASVDTPAGFDDGEWNFLQLVRRDRHMTDGGVGFHSPNSAILGLDSYATYPALIPDDPYVADSWTATSEGIHSDRDTPELPLQGDKVSINDSFAMYIMFKPPGEGHWVAVQVVTWSFHVAATKGPAGWTLDAGHGNSIGTFSAAQSEPVWTVLHQNNDDWERDPA